MRSKAIIAIERDRLQSRVNDLESRLAAQKETAAGSSEGPDSAQGRGPMKIEGDRSCGQNEKARCARGKTSDSKTCGSGPPLNNSKHGSEAHPLDTQWPSARRTIPCYDREPCAEVIPSQLQPLLSVEAHAAPVTSLCFHPTLPIRECSYIAGVPGDRLYGTTSVSQLLLRQNNSVSLQRRLEAFTKQEKCCYSVRICMCRIHSGDGQRRLHVEGVATPLWRAHHDWQRPRSKS